jgi:S-adenosylmethionine:tRNA ribosyltransferase-isomerase
MDEFDYGLPPERIAQRPVEPRDAARLLVDRGPGEPPDHRRVADLADLLGPGDLLVVNDTRVLPARLHLRKASGGAVEVLLLGEEAPGQWTALVRPGRRVPPGTELTHDGSDLRVTVGERRDDGVRVVHLVGAEHLDAVGEVPLPPYIEEPLADAERYQTVYGRRAASVAAPTAGLHLTEGLLDRLGERGVGFARVELEVGLATFRPVQVEDPADHVMHIERFHVPAETLAACERAERVVAVGTTAVRALESAALGLSGATDLYIRRGFRFRVVDVLLTNFHLPRSSLLLLVDAFVGSRWLALYETALAGDYRFLSFGDAMLLTR